MTPHTSVVVILCKVPGVSDYKKLELRLFLDIMNSGPHTQCPPLWGDTLDESEKLFVTRMTCIVRRRRRRRRRTKATLEVNIWRQHHSPANTRAHIATYLLVGDVAEIFPLLIFSVWGILPRNLVVRMRKKQSKFLGMLGAHNELICHD